MTATRTRKITMLCETCRWTERPGFVRRPQPSEPSDPQQSSAFIPCPDCGGAAIAHCCEGLCEQPDPAEPAAPDAHA
jgi:hypothetical protein